MFSSVYESLFGIAQVEIIKEPQTLNDSFIEVDLDTVCEKVMINFNDQCIEIDHDYRKFGQEITLQTPSMYTKFVDEKIRYPLTTVVRSLQVVNPYVHEMVRLTYHTSVKTITLECVIINISYNVGEFIIRVGGRTINGFDYFFKQTYDSLPNFNPGYEDVQYSELRTEYESLRTKLCSEMKDKSKIDFGYLMVLDIALKTKDDSTYWNGLVNDLFKGKTITQLKFEHIIFEIKHVLNDYTLGRSDIDQKFQKNLVEDGFDFEVIM
jgi:hypothetical protein